MVQPVRLVLSFSAILSVAAVSSRAAAEPLPSSCRTGLVLGVSEGDAQDVVAAVCAAAKTKQTAGLVRVSIVGTGDHVRVGLARLADTSKPEETVHADTPSIAAATRIAPSLLDALELSAPPVAPRPPPPPPPTPIAPPAKEETREEAKEEPKLEAEAPSALEAKAGPPAAMLSVHGVTTAAGGDMGYGGGGAIGIDHRSAQGFIDYSKATGDVEETMLTIGARIKLSKSSFKPVIGGGWSFVDYETTKGEARRSGSGIGVFGEFGAIAPIGNHQLMALARWNLGLYQERESRPVTYPNGQTYRTTSYSGAHDSLTSSFAVLAGYGYVFR